MTQHTPTSISAAGITRPFAGVAELKTFTVGVSVSDIVDEFNIKDILKPYLWVCVDGGIIEHEDWESTYPLAGQEISFKVVPQGNEGKNPLATILQVALIVAVSAIGTPAAGSTLYGLSAGQLAVAKAAIMVVGSMAIQAIAPPPTPDINPGDTTESRFLQNSGNSYVPFGTLPAVLGRHLVYPIHGAIPYTELVGDDTYLIQLFIWGVGGTPAVPSALRLGDSFLYNQTTGEDNFESVEIFHHMNMKSTDEFQLYKTDVDVADGGNARIKAPDEIAPGDDGWSTAITTQTNSTEFSITVLFQQGLYIQGTKGAYNDSVEFEIRYGDTGTDPDTHPSWKTGIRAQTLSPAALAETYYDVGETYTIYSEHADAYIESTEVATTMFDTYMILYVDMLSGELMLQNAESSSSYGIYQSAKTEYWYGSDSTEYQAGRVERKYAPLYSFRITNVQKTPTTAPAYPVYSYDPHYGYVPSHVQPNNVYTDDQGASYYTVNILSSAVISEINELRNKLMDINSDLSDYGTAYSSDQGIAVGATVYLGEFALNATPTIVSSDGHSFTLSAISVASGPAILNNYKVTGNKTRPFLREFKVFPTNTGTYDVQIRRTIADNSALGVQSVPSMAYVSNLKSIRGAVPPISVTGRQNLNITELRIKATDQLNGTVDQFNGVVESVGWLKDGAGWGVGVTSNPASIILEILLGSNNARPVSGTRIDSDAFVAFYDHCVLYNLRYDKIINSSVSIENLCREVASAGLADFSMNKSGQWTVVIDDYKTTAIQTFSPRRSWGFSAERTFVDKPHGLRLPFISEQDNWKPVEKILYWNPWAAITAFAVGDICTGIKDSVHYRFKVTTGGTTGSAEPNWNIATPDVSTTPDGTVVWTYIEPATEFEKLDLVGSTTWETIQKRARYYQAILEHRGDLYRFSIDTDSLICAHGSLIKYNSDVIESGLGNGIIKSATPASGTVTEVVLDTELTTELGKTYTIVARRNADGEEFTLPLTGVISETTDTFSVDGTYSSTTAADIENTYFVFGETGLESTRMLIKEISPSNDFTAELICVEYNENVQDYALNNNALTSWTPQIVTNEAPPTPTMTVTSTVSLSVGTTTLTNPKISVQIKVDKQYKGNTLSPQLKFRSRLTDGTDLFTPWEVIDLRNYEDLNLSNSQWLFEYIDTDSVLNGKTIQFKVRVYDTEKYLLSPETQVQHDVDYTISGIGGQDPLDFGWDAGDPQNVHVTTAFDNNNPRAVLTWEPPVDSVTRYAIFGHAIKNEADGLPDDNLLPVYDNGSTPVAGLVTDAGAGTITVDGTYTNDEIKGKLLVLTGALVGGKTVENFAMLIESNIGGILTLSGCSETDLTKSIGIAYTIRNYETYLLDIVPSTQNFYEFPIGTNHFAYFAVVGIWDYIQPYLGVMHISGTQEPNLGASPEYPLDLYNDAYWITEDGAETYIRENLITAEMEVSFSNVGQTKTFSGYATVDDGTITPGIVPEGIVVMWKDFPTEANKLKITSTISTTKLKIDHINEIETFAASSASQAGYQAAGITMAEVSTLTVSSITNFQGGAAIVLNENIPDSDWGGRMWGWVENSSGTVLTSYNKVRFTNSITNRINFVDMFDSVSSVSANDIVCYAELSWGDTRPNNENRLGFLHNVTTGGTEIVRLNGIKTDNGVYMDVTRAQEGTSTIPISTGNEVYLYYLPAFGRGSRIEKIPFKNNDFFEHDTVNNKYVMYVKDIPLDVPAGSFVHVSCCTYLEDSVDKIIRSKITVPDYVAI